MVFEGLIGTLVYYAIIGYIIHKTLCFISRFIRISLKDKCIKKKIVKFDFVFLKQQFFRCINHWM